MFSLRDRALSRRLRRQRERQLERGLGRLKEMRFRGMIACVEVVRAVGMVGEGLNVPENIRGTRNRCKKKELK